VPPRAREPVAALAGRRASMRPLWWRALQISVAAESAPPADDGSDHHTAPYPAIVCFFAVARQRFADAIAVVTAAQQAISLPALGSAKGTAASMSTSAHEESSRANRNHSSHGPTEGPAGARRKRVRRHRACSPADWVARNAQAEPP
jgi:hypothetical protein